MYDKRVVIYCILMSMVLSNFPNISRHLIISRLRSIFFAWLHFSLNTATCAWSDEFDMPFCLLFAFFLSLFECAGYVLFRTCELLLVSFSPGLQEYIRYVGVRPIPSISYIGV